MKSKIIFYFLIGWFLQSCFVFSYKYDIKGSYIKSNRKFHQGFQLSELKVDSLDSNGIPAKFERVNTAYLYLKDYQNGKKSKKIYFNKENSNYLWHYYEKWEIPILPITLKNNNWYIIDGLVFWGGPSLSKFIYLDEKGRSHQYTLPHVSNW